VTPKEALVDNTTDRGAGSFTEYTTVVARATLFV
jgi:hypothetical protein